MGSRHLGWILTAAMTGCFGGGGGDGGVDDAAAGDGAAGNTGRSGRGGGGDGGGAGTIIETLTGGEGGNAGDGQAGMGSAGVNSGGVGGGTSTFDECRDQDDCSAAGESCYDPDYVEPPCSGCFGCNGDVPPAQCITQLPCPAGEGMCPDWICYDVLDRDCGGMVKWCGPKCQIDTDCPGYWMTCTSDGTCEDASHCSVTGECPANTECNPSSAIGNGCVKVACETDADCDDFCVFGFCHASLGSCRLPPEPCLAP